MKNRFREIARRFGYDVINSRGSFVVRGDIVLTFVELLEKLRLQTVLDIGANSGQFATALRKLHYKHTIVSFEPLSACHTMLSSSAAHDSNWIIAPRMALGDAAGMSVINVAGNSYSSSLLPMLERHREGAPESLYTGTEEVEVVTLDSFLRNVDYNLRRPMAAKLDTQGFEERVLSGASETLASVDLLLLEMSLIPLYDGAPHFSRLYSNLVRAGFTCVSLMPVFVDPTNGEVLQVDGCFVRHFS